MPWPGRPLRRIGANSVDDFDRKALFDHKVLARLCGRGKLIKGNERKCSRYCDCELHVSLPVLAGATGRRLSAKASLRSSEDSAAARAGTVVSATNSGDAHLPIMTSEALITAATLSPTFRPRSSTASFVMDDVAVTPWPRSTTTCAVVAPLWTSTTLPLSWLRALSFINVLRHNRRRFSQPQSGRPSIRCDATAPQGALRQAAGGSLPQTCGA